MGQFVARREKRLLAHEFCHNESLGLIRHHIFRIIGRTFGQILLDLRKKRVEVHLFLSRYGHGACKRIGLHVAFEDRQHGGLLDEVELVDDEDARALRRLQAL